jgi:aspartate kinase
VDGPGTLIAYEDNRMEQPLVSGIAFDRNQAKITIRGVPDRPGIARFILGAVSDRDIEVDMIVQNVPSIDKKIDFSFTVLRDDYKQTFELMQEVANQLEAHEVIGDDKIAKLSIVGVGMKSHAGVATRMFQALGEEGINIHLISTSEIKISVVISEKYTELGARTLHSTFGLDTHPSNKPVSGTNQ